MNCEKVVRSDTQQTNKPIRNTFCDVRLFTYLLAFIFTRLEAFTNLESAKLQEWTYVFTHVLVSL